MSRDELAREVEKLKNGVQAIENCLIEGNVPTAVLEHFKMAVDHTRMTVWSILYAMDTNEAEVAAATVRFRLRRTIEMCRQIIGDIDSNALKPETPELPLLRTTLGETLNRIEQFCQKLS